MINLKEETKLAEHKTFNARLQQKHDVEANWLKATNFTPLKGEIIVYDEDDNYNHERFKIGDGFTLVSDLPFASVGKTSLNNNEIFNDYENNIGVAKAFKITNFEPDYVDINGVTQAFFYLDSVAGIENDDVISFQTQNGTYYD